MSRRGDALVHRREQYLVKQQQDPAAPRRTFKGLLQDWTTQWLPVWGPARDDPATRPAAAHWVQERVRRVRQEITSGASRPLLTQSVEYRVSAESVGDDHYRLLIDPQGEVTLRGVLFKLFDWLLFAPDDSRHFEPLETLHPVEVNALGLPMMVPSWFLQHAYSWHDAMGRLLGMLDTLDPTRRQDRQDHALLALNLALLSTREVWRLPESVAGSQMEIRWNTALGQRKQQPVRTNLVLAQVLRATAPTQYTLYPLDNLSGKEDWTTLLLAGSARLAEGEFPFRALPPDLNERMRKVTGADQFGVRDTPLMISVGSGTDSGKWSYWPSAPLQWTYDFAITGTATTPMAPSLPLTPPVPKVSPSRYTNIYTGVSVPTNPDPGDLWIGGSMISPPKNDPAATDTTTMLRDLILGMNGLGKDDLGLE